MVNRVVVTGTGIISPIGLSVDSFWSSLLDGDTGIVAIDQEMIPQTPVPMGGYIVGYSARDHFNVKESRRLSRSSQFAILAAQQALEQAQLLDESMDHEETAIMIGSSIGGFSASEPYFRDFYASNSMSPLAVPKSMNSGPASHVSIRYGLKGPLMSVDAACASAAQSIGYAYNLIRHGTVDIAISGGTDSPLTPTVMGSWLALRALSRRFDEPAKACRPFSGDRDGIVLGEGAGILVMESEDSAISRGKNILAEISGFGMSSDSHHITQPSVSGPSRAMRKAIQDADLEPQQIDYINAHGTGTNWNDSNETNAIKQVFGEHAYNLPVVSNKAAFGHSIAGSGALELIGCIKSLEDQVVPPTINYTTQDPECDLDYVTEGKRTHQITHIISNSFAFGGSNAALVVSKYQPNS